jgi:DNA-binding IclR family transcriptional regulator
MAARKEKTQVETQSIRVDDNDFELRELISENNGNTSDVKTIRRIAIVLACICNGIDSLADISERAKLSRSTVHRLLKGLEQSHLVIHDTAKRRYYLGSLIRHMISKPLITHEYLVICAEKEMDRLAAETEETIILGIKVGLNHVTIFSVPGTHEMRIVEPSKRVGPIHSGASAKVLLAQLNESEQKAALKNIQLEPDSNYNKDELSAQIKLIQKQGYGITSGEREFGATCIAAPVKGYEIPVALSILGPDVRLKNRLNSSVKHLLAAADRISRNIMDR